MTDEEHAKQMNLKKIITESAEVAPLVWNHKHNGLPDILGHVISYNDECGLRIRIEKKGK